MSNEISLTSSDRMWDFVLMQRGAADLDWNWKTAVSLSLCRSVLNFLLFYEEKVMYSGLVAMDYVVIVISLMANLIYGLMSIAL